MNVKTIDIDRIIELQVNLKQEQIVLKSIANDFKSVMYQFDKTIDTLQEFLNAITKK